MPRANGPAIRQGQVWREKKSQHRIYVEHVGVSWAGYPESLVYVRTLGPNRDFRTEYGRRHPQREVRAAYLWMKYELETEEADVPVER